MKPLNQTATIALLLWFIAAIALGGYADYYFQQHAFEGWGLVSSIMILAGMAVIWKFKGPPPIRYNRFPSTPHQWILQFVIFGVVILGIAFFAYQAYGHYYGGLYKTLDSNDLETT